MDKQICALKSLYECTCPHLARSLGFRDDFMQAVLHDLTRLYPIDQSLTYCVEGPGGFLFDFIFLNKLLEHGYTNLTLIFIEELYQTNYDILQACLEFKRWCSEQATQKNRVAITCHFFTEWSEYTALSDNDESMKANFFICVDPDDQKTMPNFESKKYRKTTSERLKKIMQKEGSFYFLFFENKQRHMIRGRWKNGGGQELIAYEQQWGTEKLGEKTATRLFLNGQNVLPYEVML